MFYAENKANRNNEKKRVFL